MPPDVQSAPATSPPASRVRMLLGLPALPTHLDVHAPPRPSATMQPSMPSMQPDWPTTEGTHAEEDWVEAELETVAAGTDPAPEEEPMPQAVQAPVTAPPPAGPAPRRAAAIPLHRPDAQPVAQSEPQQVPPTSPQTLPVVQSAAEVPQPPHSVRAQEPADDAPSVLRPSVVPVEERPTAVEVTTLDIPGRAAARPEEHDVEQPVLPEPAPAAASPAPHAEAPVHPAHPRPAAQVSAAQQPTLPRQPVNPETSVDAEKRGQSRLPELPIAEFSTSRPTLPPTRIRPGVDQIRPPRTTRQPGPDTSSAVEVVRSEHAGQNAATTLSGGTVLEPSQFPSRQSPAMPPSAPEPVPVQRHQEANSLLAQPGADSGRVLSNRQPLPTVQPPSWTHQPSPARDAGQRESAVVRELRKQIDDLAATVATHEKERREQADAPPLPQSVVILNRLAPAAPNTRAFWARSYRSRAHLRTFR